MAPVSNFAKLDATRIGFSDFSAELRNAVYEAIIQECHWPISNGHRYRNDKLILPYDMPRMPISLVALSRVSKQFSAEIRPMWLASWYRVHIQGQGLSVFRTDGLRLLRNILVSFRSESQIIKQMGLSGGGATEQPEPESIIKAVETACLDLWWKDLRLDVRISVGPDIREMTTMGTALAMAPDGRLEFAHAHLDVSVASRDGLRNVRDFLENSIANGRRVKRIEAVDFWAEDPVVNEIRDKLRETCKRLRPLHPVQVDVKVCSKQRFRPDAYHNFVIGKLGEVFDAKHAEPSEEAANL